VYCVALHSVAVCCNELKCADMQMCKYSYVNSSVLQCVAVYYGVLHYVAVLWHADVRVSLLQVKCVQCVAVYCSVLHSVLHSVTVCCTRRCASILISGSCACACTCMCVCRDTEHAHVFFGAGSADVFPARSRCNAHRLGSGDVSSGAPAVLARRASSCARSWIWIIHKCDMIHSCVCDCSTRANSCARQWTFICVIWRIRACASTTASVVLAGLDCARGGGHGPFICVMWCIHACDMTHSCAYWWLCYSYDRSFSEHHFICVTPLYHLVCMYVYIYIYIYVYISIYIYI